MDVAERRVALTRRLAEGWAERPPADVMIAAGSTGSAPATADLLAAIARAPRGAVVLPGLDTDLADDAWDEVDESHPQGTLKRLLERAGVGRASVASWDPETAREPAGRWRRRLVNEALRPPRSTADWLKQIDRLREEAPPSAPDPIAEGLRGLSVISARGEEEASVIAALLLRETLETPNRTAALITPDDALARRVSARLTRWGITADSSAGQSLAATPAAVLVGLLARAASDPLAPVTLLAILKHPLTRLGREARTLQAARATFERRGLRGPRPVSWDDLASRLAEPGAERAQELIAPLRQMAGALAAPFADGLAAPADAARALVRVLETLATGVTGDRGDLWAGQAGEALARLLSGVIEESGALPPITPRGFADLLEGLMARERLRTGGASHPRLHILGVLEARLVRADRLILAGLEEGVWPQAAPVDPFLSRPMRERLGLLPPERRIGLSAHDFAQAACAPRGNPPASPSGPARRARLVQSRWLWRLETLAAGAELTLPAVPDIVAWARALDAPLAAPPAALRPAPRPAPRPPLSARPRRLAVTAVERWLRDPYGLYARDILKLRPLDRPDEPVEARARGIAFHAAFERFAKEHPGDPPDAEVFAGLLLDELRLAGMPSSRMTREHALAANVAPWVIDFERRRRPGARLIIEQQGELAFSAPGGLFTLTAKADRIETRGALGDVLDFKTGQVPSPKQVESGISPQLTLTAAILAGGGFAEAGRKTPGELLYVRVNGGRVPGCEFPRDGGEASRLAAEALAGLKRRVAYFDREETPYESWARPQFRGRFGGDYDHLARLWEWFVMGDDADTPP